MYTHAHTHTHIITQYIIANHAKCHKWKAESAKKTCHLGLP